MFFYKIEANLVEADETSGRRKRDEQADVFQTQAEEAFMASGQNCYIFISSEHRDKLTCGAISRSPEDIKRAMPPFMEKLGFRTEPAKVSEITMKALFSLANCADRVDYIEDSDELLACFGLEDIACGRRDFFSEHILDCPKGLTQLKKLAQGLPCECGLIDELERVFALTKSSVPVKGHPVHYMICAEDRATRVKTLNILLSALFGSGRLASRRCCTVDWPTRYTDIDLQLELIYASSIDGVVVFDSSENTLGDDGDRQVLLKCMR